MINRDKQPSPGVFWPVIAPDIPKIKKKSEIKKNFYFANILAQGLHLNAIFSQATNCFPCTYKLSLLRKEKDQYFKRA